MESWLKASKPQLPLTSVLLISNDNYVTAASGKTSLQEFSVLDDGNPFSDPQHSYYCVSEFSETKIIGGPNTSKQ